MPNKLISMSKVRSLLRLCTEGVSKNAIAERLGLPRNTVKKYIRLFLACGSTLEDLEALSDWALLDIMPEKNSRWWIRLPVKSLTWRFLCRFREAASCFEWKLR
jgi:hypothetical protein